MPRRCCPYHLQRMGVFLAIETSQRVGGVALRDQRDRLHVEMLAPRKRHDDDLLPAIDRVFGRAGLTASDLRGGAVGVSIGPGGFTGLRIAVTTAKMFAETLGVTLIAVPSALVAAQSTLDATSVSGEVMVCLACKGESCWCTRLRPDAGAWRIIGQPSLLDAQTLEISGISVLLADAFLPEPLRRICEQYSVRVVEPSFDPGACLEIGERWLGEGASIDALTLSPLYPREPEAVTLWNARHVQR